tara:strand:- start:13505 stop:15430 length:1926 start_codon:yes stop_codon:yes gene_type:complete
MKKIVLLIICVQTWTYSQQNTWKADRLYADFHFEEAAQLYQNAIGASNRIDPVTVEKLANCYFNLNEYGEALVWYDKLYHLKSKQLKESTFIKFLQTVKSNRDYERANALIKEFYAGDGEKMQMITAQKKHLEKLGETDSLYKITNLDINTSMSDFAPVFYKDHVLFTSSRDTTVPKEQYYQWNDQPYLNLYSAERNKSTGELREVTKLMADADYRFHDATMSFDKDGGTVYFVQNYVKGKKLKGNKEGISNFRILRGIMQGDRIVNATALAFNHEDYSCGHPAISPDGKYLFFISDMPGGYGETDIYVTEVFGDGSTNTPVNLGPKINTAGREMFPFMVDGILYFSSDAHYGLGGLDVFGANMHSKSSYDLPLNLGATINSNRDDFSFILDTKENKGYFASNRALGKGDDDIYHFEKMPPIANYIYSGHVYDAKTKEALDRALVQVFDSFDNGLTSNMETDENGYYEFQLPQLSQELLFSKQGYSSVRESIKRSDTLSKNSTANDVYLTSLESLTVREGNLTMVDVEPIYFDLGKANITPLAEMELQKVLFVLQSFPETNIRIEAHTDSRGSDSLNMELSKKRAENTERYLVANGVDPSRVRRSEGFGESRLKNRCSNGVTCDEWEHAINRRSNFILVHD